MNIALFGYGKMGKMIEELIIEGNKQQLHSHSIGLKVNSKNYSSIKPKDLEPIDVAIEFSQPETAFGNISTCLKAGIPVVSGTTGWLSQYKEVAELASQNNTAFLYASNFSIGVNLFFEISRQVAKLMDKQVQYDVQVEETHHIHKKDAPSGTAITLSEEIIKNVSRKNSWALNEVNMPKELLILAHRENEVPGTHSIIYESPVDSVILTHEAHSRRGFAEGAILAAKWIIGKKGIFEMKDVLNLKD